MIPVRHRQQLTKAAENVIQQVCQQRLGAMKRPPAVEIDFIASLVENGAPLLEIEWQKILAPDRVSVRVAGIFCHQSPMVDINGKPPRAVPTQRCELADLMILHSHSMPDGKVFWRGVLIQAKADSGRNVTPDEPQLWLYQDWPNFVITAPGFNRRQRDFDRDERSGRYALVSKSGWHVLRAGNPLVAKSTASVELSEFLVKMLYDMDPAQPSRTSTHGKQVYQNSLRDWSPTIWDLVEVTAKNALRHRGRKHGLYDRDLSRLGGGVLQMTLDAAVQHSHLPPRYEGAVGVDGDGDGVSILVVETRSTDGAETRFIHEGGFRNQSELQ